MAEEYNATNSRTAVNPLNGNKGKEASMQLKIIPDIVKDKPICALPASSTAIAATKAMVAHNCAAVVKAPLEKDIRETEAFVFGDRYGA